MKGERDEQAKERGSAECGRGKEAEGFSKCRSAAEGKRRDKMVPYVPWPEQQISPSIIGLLCISVKAC